MNHTVFRKTHIFLILVGIKLETNNNKVFIHTFIHLSQTNCKRPVKSSYRTEIQLKKRLTSQCSLIDLLIFGLHVSV